MRTFFGVLKGDLKRAFLSVRFLTAVLLLTIINIISALGEVMITANINTLTVVYLMQNFIFYSSFAVMTTFIGVIPYGPSFCEDWNNQFIRPCIIRSSPTKYGISKVVSTFLSATLAIFAGYMLTVLLFSLKWNMVSEEFFTEGYTLYDNSSIGKTLETSPLLYLILKSLLHSFSAAFWAVFALCISTYVTTTFTTFAIPVITYYIAINLEGIPSALRLNVIMNGSVNFANPYSAFWNGVFVFIGLSVIVGAWFCVRVKRRLAHG